VIRKSRKENLDKEIRAEESSRDKLGEKEKSIGSTGTEKIERTLEKSWKY